MISEQPDARPICMTGVERGSRTVVVGLGSPIMCDDAVGLRVSEAIDAIMLTSETTIGAHPIDTVRIVSKIIRESEDSIDYGYFFRNSLNEKQKSITATVSSSVVLGANELDCKAIVVATNYGRTARRISNLKPPCPIIAAASRKEVVKSLQLHFGVLPVIAKGDTLDELTENVKKKLENTLPIQSKTRTIGYSCKPIVAPL